MMTEKDAGRKDADGRNKVERQGYGAQTKILLCIFIAFLRKVGKVGIFWHSLLLPRDVAGAAKRLAGRGGDAKIFFCLRIM